MTTMSASATKPQDAAAAPSSATSLVTICGRIGANLLVEHPSLGVVEASTTVCFDRDTLAAAIEGRRRGVALICDQQVVVTGLLQALPEPTPDDAREPLVIDSPHGIVLRCGTSSIRLLPDGRVVVRGKNIVSRAVQQQQLVGGVIRIN